MTYNRGTVRDIKDRACVEYECPVDVSMRELGCSTFILKNALTGGAVNRCVRWKQSSTRTICSGEVVRLLQGERRLL